MKKACSLLLAFVMILSLFPSYALAEDTGGTNPPETEIEELTTKPEDSGQLPEDQDTEITQEEATAALLDEAAEVSVWDLFDADTKSYGDNFKRIVSTKSEHKGLYGTVEQRGDYVNVSRDDDQSVNLPTGGGYTWFSTQKSVDFPDNTFTIEASVRLGGARNGKANEISARVDKKGFYPVFLKYGAAGGIATKSDYSDLVELDTTQWHNYGLVIDPIAKTYDVYVDGVMVFEHVASASLTGADLFRIGADSDARCDMDIQSVRIGVGDLSSNLIAYNGEDYADNGRLVMAELSSDKQSDTGPADVSVTVHSQGYTEATEVTLSLLDGTLTPVSSVTTTQNLSGSDRTSIRLTIPAGLKTGTYFIKAETIDSDIFSAPYTVVTGAAAPDFPKFAAVGYTIDMTDYRYNPTQEFNFPTIVDTKGHKVDNALTKKYGKDFRYYLFYAPHNNPGGNCVAVSNSLEGPWTEYGNNPVVKNEWEPNYKVGHISSPHVMWHEESGKYIMYYHGENPTTRYALSDDLINWEYGGVCVTANQFSTTGSGFSEASYARVYEHTVPGLDNKYIMLLMITGSGNNMHRNIYWAHSKDGIEWTPVQEPLLNPDINPVYKSNFSGPFFMPWEVDGELRYFVICHASSGEMYAFEVGEKLDQCIEWGEVYNSQGVRNVDDANPECYPDYGRSGAPFFIQDDEGRWHMFYEAGKRLNTNIVHAVEVKDGEEGELARAGLELENTTLLADGTARPVLHLFDKSNGVVPANTEGLSLTYHVSDESVIQYENGVITALKEGKATAWVVAKLGEVEVASSKAAVTVAAPSKEVIITNADTPNKTALNLELPAVFKAEGVLDKPYRQLLSLLQLYRRGGRYEEHCTGHRARARGPLDGIPERHARHDQGELGRIGNRQRPLAHLGQRKRQDADVLQHGYRRHRRGRVHRRRHLHQSENGI